MVYAESGGRAMREKLAAYAHKAWSGWIMYMFDKCVSGQDGTLIIPKEFVERWYRQASTGYVGLPEDEKKSDREEADKITDVFCGTGWREEEKR